jgi:hypothetical protein
VSNRAGDLWMRGPGGSGTAALVLTFLAAPKGRVLATAMVELEGCEPVIFAPGATKITNDTRTWNAPGSRRPACRSTVTRSP